MLIKPLFIIHVTVKAFLLYTVVQKLSISVTKVGVAHAYCTFIFQVSVQINEVLLYNEK